MLTVHQMLLENRFLNGIGSGYDKILGQNGPKPNSTLSFTGDCLCVDSCTENYQQKILTATEPVIFNFSSTKPGVGLMLGAQGFDFNRDNFKMETAKNDKFLQLFTSFKQAEKKIVSYYL